MRLAQPSARYGLLIILFTIGLSGCQWGTKPVIKIGLIAPFEGELSHVGYQRLYGVKLALQEANQQGGVAGYKLELVALNDYGDKQEARVQIQELVIDLDVMAVIGQWDPALFAEAWVVYEQTRLVAVAPGQFTDLSALPATFDTAYQALSHTPATPESKQAYLATVYLIQAIEQTINQHGQPSREELWHRVVGAIVN